MWWQANKAVIHCLKVTLSVLQDTTVYHKMWLFEYKTSSDTIVYIPNDQWNITKFALVIGGAGDIIAQSTFIHYSDI